jgi:hypothetical protein
VVVVVEVEEVVVMVMVVVDERRSFYCRLVLLMNFVYCYWFEFCNFQLWAEVVAVVSYHFGAFCLYKWKDSMEEVVVAVVALLCCCCC